SIDDLILLLSILRNILFSNLRSQRSIEGDKLTIVFVRNHDIVDILKTLHHFCLSSFLLEVYFYKLRMCGLMGFDLYFQIQIGNKEIRNIEMILTIKFVDVGMRRRRFNILSL